MRQGGAAKHAVVGWLATMLLVASPIEAQDRPIVMIDAGHGGEVAGVEHDGLLEKDLVLRIAFTMGAEFVANGYDVRFTRTGDYDVEWPDRRSMAEKAGAVLLIMLHANGDEDVTKHGAEIYAYLEDPGSRRAAEAVGDAMREAGSEVLIEAHDWAFLQSSTVPTVMVELAFMTHPVERRLLLSRAFHHELGRIFVDATNELTGR